MHMIGHDLKNINSRTGIELWDFLENRSNHGARIIQNHFVVDNFSQ